MNDTEARLILICKRPKTLELIGTTLKIMNYTYSYFHLCRVCNSLAREGYMIKRMLGKSVYYSSTKTGIDKATDILINGIDEKVRLVQGETATTIKDFIKCLV